MLMKQQSRIIFSGDSLNRALLWVRKRPWGGLEFPYAMISLAALWHFPERPVMHWTSAAGCGAIPGLCYGPPLYASSDGTGWVRPVGGRL